MKNAYIPSSIMTAIIVVLLFFVLAACNSGSPHHDDTAADMHHNATNNNKEIFISEPLWITKQNFANNQAARGIVRTNYSMRDSIMSWWEDYHENIYDMLRWSEVGFAVNTDVSDSLRLILINAWENERLAAAMPFNHAFFKDLVSGIDFVIVRGSYIESGDGMGGFMSSSASNAQIAIDIAPREAWCFTWVLFHEFGHALGLGDSLSDLFADELMGCKQLPEFLRESKIRVFLGSIFDRTLLRQMEAQNRTNEFWAAALHSEEAYKAIWDEHIPTYICFQNIRLLRTVSQKLRPYFPIGYDHELSSELYQLTGSGIEDVIDTILMLWEFFHGENGQNYEQYYTKLNELHNLVKLITGLAYEFDIYLIEGFTDFVINDHHIRHKRSQEQ